MAKYILFGWLVLFGFVRTVTANEGTSYLRPEAGKMGECFVASIYLDGGYRVMASCRGLPVAWTAEKNRYVLWKMSGEKVSRVGELINGKVSNSVSEKFERLFVTAESENYVNKPSEDVVVSGDLAPLAFDGKTDSRTFYTPTPTTSQKGTGLDLLTPTPVKSSTNRLAGVVMGVLKVVILGFILLLVVVGVLSFLARKRGL